MHFAVPLLIFTAIINLALGSFVLLRNPRILLSRSFASLSLSVAAWSLGVVGYYVFTSIELITLSVKWFYITALLMNASLLVFTGAFLKLKNKKLYLYFPMLSWALMTILIVVFDSFLFKITGTQAGSNVVLKPLTYGLYTVLVIGYYLVTLHALISHRKSGDIQKRHQIRYILAGLILAGLFASYFNVLLPWLDNYKFVWSGPLFTAGFVGLISYAILKHRLFDIRFTVARALAYVGAVATIALVYIAVIYFLTSINVLSSNLTTLQRLSYVAIAVLSGFLFQPFKVFFDKQTNKVFYRDAYDAQALIDQLNQTLVNTVELETLLTKSSLIIQETFKTTYCTFYIRETSYFEGRIIGAHRKEPEIEAMSEIEEIASGLHKKVHTVELETANDNEKALNEHLKKNDFEVMARLVSTLEYEVKGIGYIFIGPKRSGSLFSKKDLKIIEIIANELVIAVENVLRFEEIEEFNVTLQKKIDDATKELKASNDKLRALDEAKDEFVSMASHQLRTPLTSIKGYISMVLEGDAGKINDTQKEMLGQAFFSSQRMVYLISDLLNVSRLKTGKFIIETKPVYLPDLVEDEINQLQEGAKSKKLTLSFTKPKSFPTLKLDDMKIRQVVMNFTDNALYYTPTGGKIEVSLRETPKSIEFTVKDNGIGVPKEQQPKMFTKFYRADNARKARPDGTGLGLFMAKKVIIAQGGSVIFDSKEGKGSTFGFSFPREKLEVTTSEPQED